MTTTIKAHQVTITIGGQTLDLPASGEYISTARVLRPRPGAQARLLTSDADIAMWIGPHGGGKTTGLLLDWGAMTPANVYGLILRADYMAVRDPFDHARRLYGGSVDRIREQPRDIKWHSGSVLDFRHMDASNYTDFAGLECAWIGIDQCEEFAWEHVAYAGSRLRTHRPGVTSRLRIAGNDLPRGIGEPLLAALNRTEWPGPGAKFMATDRRSLQPLPYLFGPTREATAEMAGCSPGSVFSFDLITGA